METRHTVILIDDNELTRTALRLSLPNDTVVVVGEAGGGRAGLDLCLRLKPEIVLLDVVMPDMGGLDILPDLKKALPGTEVIMVTAANDRETIQQAIAAGACGYVVKPFSAGRVEDSINRAISLGKQKLT
jgi:two-component system chemotaxis response regulator CheY